MVDWTTVTSVILGIFLFNILFQGLKFVLAVSIGLIGRRQLTSLEHNHNDDGFRGSFGA